jgi:hypothetical protein
MTTLADMRRLPLALRAVTTKLPPTAEPVPADVRRWCSASRARWLLSALPSPREPASPGRPDHDYDHDTRRGRDARIL